jgi:hypothetical protein
MSKHDPKNDLPSPKAESNDEKRSLTEQKGDVSTFLRPEFQALSAINALIAPQDKKQDSLNLGALYKEIQSITKAVSSGDMSRPEEIAMAQITTLDRLFTRLLEIAFQNLEQGHFESLLRVALKAQMQCARTIETLATLKNPSVITKQLNMANQQVVNNGTLQTGPQGATPNPVELPNALSEADAVNSSICAFPTTPARETVPKKS